MNKVYKVKGTTDEVTECDLCGRMELKGTVVLLPLDVDGNPDGDAEYMGSSCAAKAAGWTQREVTRRVKEAADTARREEQAARDAVEAARYALYADWLLRTYGSADQRIVMQQLGHRTARKLSEEYDASR